MIRARITLREGGALIMDCTDLEIVRNKITNELTGVNWKTNDKARYRLFYVRVEEVAGITTWEVPDDEIQTHPDRGI